MPPTKCMACAKFLSPQEAARCRTCRGIYHRNCAGLPFTGNIPPNWSCSDCNRKEERQQNTEKALGSDESFDSSSNMSPNMCKWIAEEVRRAMKEELRAEFTKMRADFQAEFQALRAEIAKLQSDKDKLAERVGVLEDQLKSSTAIADEVAQLKMNINDRDQQLLRNDIEITNLPETNNEQLTHVVKLVATKLNIVLEDRDIISVRRVGARHLNATSSAGPVEARARPVVARFARSDLRDEFLRSARVRRGADTSDFGATMPLAKFYINERLTQLNRQLFRRAREAAQQRGWKYTWTKNGRILTRRKEGDQASIIRNEDDLSRVFI